MTTVAPKRAPYEAPTLKKLTPAEIKAAWYEHVDACSECDGWTLCETGKVLLCAVQQNFQLKLPGFDR